MISAFQSNAFQNNAFQIDVTVVGSVGGGGTGRHYREYGARDPRNKYLTKRRWEELLETIRLEKVALEAPARAKKAQAAVLNAKRAAAELAEQLALFEAQADAESLAREIVAAERASKAGDALRLAAQAMDMIADIQARIDEDEDDVMMLASAL